MQDLWGIVHIPTFAFSPWWTLETPCPKYGFMCECPSRCEARPHSRKRPRMCGRREDRTVANHDAQPRRTHLQCRLAVVRSGQQCQRRRNRDMADVGATWALMNGLPCWARLSPHPSSPIAVSKRFRRPHDEPHTTKSQTHCLTRCGHAIAPLNANMFSLRWRHTDPKRRLALLCKQARTSIHHR